MKQMAETLALLHHPEFRSVHNRKKLSTDQLLPTDSVENQVASNSFILCHRDIKPQNIFIADDYQTLKLADFSFLIRLNEDNSLAEEGLKNTKLCGSIPHLAPELYIQMNIYNIFSPTV